MNRILFLLLCLAVNFSSCKKDDDDPETPTIPAAGLGGSAEISSFVRYNDTLVAGAKIYVKFGTDVSPGTDTTQYDLLKTCGSTGHGLGHAHISGLHQGKYFLYAVAYDTLNSTFVSGSEGIILEGEEDHEEINITLE
jgi:hypothetical protein